MASTETVKFGIPLLDEALGGGIPRGSVLLLEDEVGVDDEPLMLQFLAEGLQTGEYTYILSTEHPYSHYRRLMVHHGIDEIVVETRRLVYLDGFSNPFGYSEMAGVAEGSVENVIRDITQPRQVTDSIRRGLMHVRNQPVRGVLDSITTILLVSDSLKPPMSFLQHKIATDKRNGYVSLLTLHTDVHEPHVIRAIEHYVDGIIRIRTIEPTEGRLKKQPVLEVVKMTGVNLAEVPATQFLYTTRPGSVQLTPTETVLEQ